MVWDTLGAEIPCGGYQADGPRHDYQASASHPELSPPSCSPSPNPTLRVTPLLPPPVIKAVNKKNDY